ncbi:MAG: hypothetical protein ACREMR_06395 [Gemmatimonadales bacterium]
MRAHGTTVMTVLLLGATSRGIAGQAPAPERTIAVGQSLRGDLTKQDVLRRADSAYAQSWVTSGVAGRTVTIDLASDTFDPYLFVTGPGFEREPQDDDSGGSCNARLTVTFPRDGDYTIVVSTADRYGLGPFTLSVTRGAKPKSLTGCDR